MLPDDKAEAVSEEMDKYRRKEYMKWYMNRHDFDDDQAIKLGNLAANRGAKRIDAVPGPGQLMSMALEGFIKPEDLK